jgi:hypothetical protein
MSKLSKSSIAVNSANVRENVQNNKLGFLDQQEKSTVRIPASA